MVVNEENFSTTVINEENFGTTVIKNEPETSNHYAAAIQAAGGSTSNSNSNTTATTTDLKAEMDDIRKEFSEFKVLVTQQLQSLDKALLEIKAQLKNK